MTPADRELEREVIREHLRRIMDDLDADPKIRLQAMQMLGKDAGMWAQETQQGAMSLQVLIADMRNGPHGPRTVEARREVIVATPEAPRLAPGASESREDEWPY